jgi:hypothetical protein
MISRSKLLNAVVEARINAICDGTTCEDYLREVLRYGLPTEPLVDLSDQQLIALLEEHNLTEEDI